MGIKGLIAMMMLGHVLLLQYYYIGLFGNDFEPYSLVNVVDFTQVNYKEY